MDFNLSFENLINSIINFIENNDTKGDIEIDDSIEGILKLICGQQIFVINKNSMLNQVWLSSPISGAYHFTLHKNKWITGQGEELEKIFYKDLQLATNIIFSY